MNSALTRALRAAMDFESPDRRINAVKVAVSNALQAGDPSARIRHTEYFNHTFAPDMVVTWPREKRQRLVFLRADPNPLWLAEDLQVIADSHPIMLSLDSTTGTVADVSAKDDLIHVAKGARALVSDPGAIDEFTASRSPMGSVLTNALFRGGRGVVDAQAARSATSAAVAGYSGASSLDSQPVEAALSSAEILLDDEQAGRISRLLQAVWEGHGGVPSDFPRESRIGGRLTNQDIVLLLTTVEAEEPQFWRRVGRTIKLEQLTSLDVMQGTDNLDRLIGANIDRLSARSARVFGGQQELGERPQFMWTVQQQCVALRSSRWTIFFAGKMDDLPPAIARSGVRVSDLMNALRDLELRLTDIKIQQPSFAISIEAMGEANVVDSPDFSDLAERGPALAKSAAIATSSGRNLIADFVSGTASGHTNATFTLDELAPITISLLLQLNVAAASALRSRIPVDHDEGSHTQPTLWD